MEDIIVSKSKNKLLLDLIHQKKVNNKIVQTCFLDSKTSFKNRLI